MRKSNDLITKDIKKLIFQIAIPSSVGMFFNTMYNVVDTFYVGLISTIAISALSYSFIVYFMLLSISFGLSSAITVYVGNSLGKGKKSFARIYAMNGISFFAIISVLLCIFGYIFSEDIFILMGAKGEALDLALSYTYIILIGTIPLLLGLGANAVLVARGDTKSYRNTLIFGFFANLLLNPIFMYGYGIIPSFGFNGVAIATVLIQFINFLYIFSKFYDTKFFHFKRFFSNLPNFNVYKDLLHQAIPASLNMFLMSLGTMIVSYFVSDYGYKEMAAFGIGYRVEQIILLPMLGLNVAVSTIVANNFGAKNYERIDEVIKKSLMYGYIMSGIGVLLLAIFGKYIVMIFTRDSIVIDIAYGYIVVESLIFFAFITIFISNSTLQGIKKPLAVPIISFYRQILMPSIVLFFVVKIWALDIIFVWISMLIIVYSAAIFIFIFTKRNLFSVTG
ncbi:MAG: MATE family efflux transporter [Epsilonproteobacteria bacterium]|nr:MATE family efflux transporter [Campylobacterota bacterium]